VLPGGTDRSYGIHVARMAGVPGSVLRRAQEVLGELEDRVKAPTAVRGAQKIQLTLFEAEDPEIIKELRSLDIDRITPMDALKFLEVWKQKHTT
jgi:DNA mismatch repair protein MutS